MIVCTRRINYKHDTRHVYRRGCVKLHRRVTIVASSYNALLKTYKLPRTSHKNTRSLTLGRTVLNGRVSRLAVRPRVFRLDIRIHFERPNASAVRGRLPEDELAIQPRGAAGGTGQRRSSRQPGAFRWTRRVDASKMAGKRTTGARRSSEASATFSPINTL